MSGPVHALGVVLIHAVVAAGLIYLIAAAVPGSRVTLGALVVLIAAVSSLMFIVRARRAARRSRAG